MEIVVTYVRRDLTISEYLNEWRIDIVWFHGRHFS